MLVSVIWLDAWSDVLKILDKAVIESIEDFDNCFRGAHSLFSWIEDLDEELQTAGFEDHQFLRARIAVYEEALKRFDSEDENTTGNLRRSLAESYFDLGEVRKGEALFAEWLKADPCWGWGWISWSDCYQDGPEELRNPKRSEELLREALSVTGVRNYGDIADRLAGLYREQGREKDVAGVRGRVQTSRLPIVDNLEIESKGPVLRQETTISFGGQGVPLPEFPRLARQLGASPRPATHNKRKGGRNDPCPCGSGKKFKRCCG
jgi:tetratricopeptide (TPR) repeat protein